MVLKDLLKYIDDDVKVVDMNGNLIGLAKRHNGKLNSSFKYDEYKDMQVLSIDSGVLFEDTNTRGIRVMLDYETSTKIESLFFDCNDLEIMMNGTLSKHESYTIILDKLSARIFENSAYPEVPFYNGKAEGLEEAKNIIIQVLGYIEKE